MGGITSVNNKVTDVKLDSEAFLSCIDVGSRILAINDKEGAPDTDEWKKLFAAAKLPCKITFQCKPTDPERDDAPLKFALAAKKTATMKSNGYLEGTIRMELEKWRFSRTEIEYAMAAYENVDTKREKFNKGPSHNCQEVLETFNGVTKPVIIGDRRRLMERLARAESACQCDTAIHL